MNLIRKYENRRLYDTRGKRYVNLDEIAAMIRGGEEIQVVDARSGEDLTRSILTQIIVEDARNSKDRGLPLEILHELIALPGKAKNELLTLYLDAYRRAQHLFAGPPPPAAAAVPDEGSRGELAALREKVEVLERLVRGAAAAPPARTRKKKK
jgi:polyhydroxyalkanoate synthesis repressor PhaR